jgi:hypothetical protein
MLVSFQNEVMDISMNFKCVKETNSCSSVNSFESRVQSINYPAFINYTGNLINVIIFNPNARNISILFLTRLMSFLYIYGAKYEVKQF